MKKIIMMLVTMSMILSLVACGNSKETSGNEIVTEESTVKESEEVNGGVNNAADTTSVIPSAPLSCCLVSSAFWPFRHRDCS